MIMRNPSPPPITHDDLVAALLSVPALELKGVVLLREYRAAGVLPEDRGRLIEATEELVGYTKACAETARALRGLEPVPSAEETLAEDYPL